MALCRGPSSSNRVSKTANTSPEAGASPSGSGRSDPGPAVASTVGAGVAVGGVRGRVVAGVGFVGAEEGTDVGVDARGVAGTVASGAGAPRVGDGTTVGAAAGGSGVGIAEEQATAAAATTRAAKIPRHLPAWRRTGRYNGTDWRTARVISSGVTCRCTCWLLSNYESVHLRR